MKKTLSLLLALMPLMAFANLYIVGTAISTNWTRQQMTETASGVYSWEGYLTYGGELKFMPNADEWTDHWGPATSNTPLNDGTQEIKYFTTNDHKYLLATEGDYKVVVDTNNRTITLERKNATTVSTYPDRLYPAGSAVKEGSDFALSMTTDGVYEGRVSLQKGVLNFAAITWAADGKPTGTDFMKADNATATMPKLAGDITTDKCAYQPGQDISFTLTDLAVTHAMRVRYRHLEHVVDDQPLTAATWTWKAPKEDFRGYMVEVYAPAADGDVIYATTAVDVSSDWRRFPRYGFVATFGGDKTASRTRNEMAWLNRCHINGVQFQDWHYAHDWPLGGTRDNLDKTYKDVANRTIYTSAIKHYIDAQHAFGMKSIFYNLCFGALDGYADRGVKENWFIYTDDKHMNKDKHSLPESWKSDIYLVNPGNEEWHAYLADRNDDVYHALDFDGYQIDQLGWRGGPRYDYYGNSVNIEGGYQPFIHAMKYRHPEKRLVMNAVSEYGQEDIAKSGKVDFLYNEVWGNHDYDANNYEEGQFQNLRGIIERNRNFNRQLQTVFAAYMNYCKDNDYFNTPGIVMADAVMFALGGSHLELGGDHMLCREYFPYTGMKWHDEIEDWMKHYYDFMTGYENLLRGNWSENNRIQLFKCDGMKINRWKPVAGQVTMLPRDVKGKKVVHLLNFTDSSASADDNYLLCWHDKNGNRPWPVEYKDVKITLNGVKDGVGRVWVASPDYRGGALTEITDFTYTAGTQLSFTLPYLRFWTMVVIEPETPDGDPVSYGPVLSEETATIDAANAISCNENVYDIALEGEYAVKVDLTSGVMTLSSTDAIDTPQREDNKEHRTYTLGGQHLDSATPQKGAYIVDGKKVVK